MRRESRGVIQRASYSSIIISHSSLVLFADLAGDALGLLAGLFDGADEVEGAFGEVVVLAVHDLLEAADGVGDGDVLALEAGELLGDVEGLREEALNLARARDDQLVLLRKLVEAEDGDDVLQVLVALENLLDGLRGRVVLVADDARVEDARGRG